MLAGIRRTASALKAGRIVICSSCDDCLREMEEYVWDPAAQGADRVKKTNDHAMDDMRYFVSTVLREQAAPFAALAVSRRGQGERRKP